MDLKQWMESHKKVVYGGLAAVGLFGGYALLKGKKSSSPQSSTQYLTPDQLVASPSGGIVTLGGTSGGVETLQPPGLIGGSGASQTGGATQTTPTVTAASLLGFSNGQTPVRLVGGSLIDTGTGRVAYYGPNGQPGSASQFAGATQWTDPTGKTVYYNPNGYNYADTTRAPDLPPLAA